MLAYMNIQIDLGTSGTGWLILLLLFGLSAAAPAFTAWACYQKAIGAKIWKYSILWAILAVISSMLLVQMGRHVGLDSGLWFMMAVPCWYIFWTVVSSRRALVKIRQKRMQIHDLAGVQLLWLLLTLSVWFGFEVLFS